MPITPRLTLELDSADVTDDMLLALHLMKVQGFVILEILVTDSAVVMLLVLVNDETLLIVESTTTRFIGARELLAEMSRMRIVPRGFGILSIMKDLRLGRRFGRES